MRFAYLLCGLLAVAGLAGPLPAAAQYAPWTTRHLDAEASLQMPTEGTEDVDPKAPALPGVRRFFMDSSDNSFEIFRIDLQALSPKTAPRANRQYQFDVSKFLTQYFKDPHQPFHRAKLLHEYPVKVPTAPYGTGSHRVYHGFDEQTQAAAVLETTWVYRNGILYLLGLTHSSKQVLE